jgi:thymidine phosphorylase
MVVIINDHENKALNRSCEKVYRMPDLIMKKRDGDELNKEEIDFFIRAICDKNNNLIQESQIGNLKTKINFTRKNHK